MTFYASGLPVKSTACTSFGPEGSVGKYINNPSISIRNTNSLRSANCDSKSLPPIEFCLLNLKIKKMAFPLSPFFEDFLATEVKSESTLALLNFLLGTKPGDSTERICNVLHEVTARVGEQPPPIPDESEQFKTEWLKLIKDGPGHISGRPRVKIFNVFG